MNEKLVVVRKRGVWVEKKAHARSRATKGPIVGANRNWRTRKSGEVGTVVSIKFSTKERMVQKLFIPSSHSFITTANLRLSTRYDFTWRRWRPSSQPSWRPSSQREALP